MRGPHLFLSALLQVALLCPGQSQTTKPDPFEGHYLLRDRKQIVTLKTYPWLIQQTYDFKHLPGVGDSLMSGPDYQYPDSLRLLFQSCEDGGVDIVASNVAGDRLACGYTRTRSQNFDRSLTVPGRTSLSATEGQFESLLLTLWLPQLEGQQQAGSCRRQSSSGGPLNAPLLTFAEGASNSHNGSGCDGLPIGFIAGKPALKARRP